MDLRQSWLCFFLACPGDRFCRGFEPRDLRVTVGSMFGVAKRILMTATFSLCLDRRSSRQPSCAFLL
jgi:hypothetical protein